MLAGYRRSAIRRAVIHHDDLEGRIAQSAERFQALRQMIGRIVRGDDDRDRKRHEYSLLEYEYITGTGPSA